MNVIRIYSQTGIVKLPRYALIMANSQKSYRKTNSIHNSEVTLDNGALDLHTLLYPYMIRDVLTRNGDPQLLDAIKRFDEVCYYTGPNREMYPSLTLIDAYKILEDPKKMTPDSLQLASILAWCFEMITTSFIVTDDIMDNQEVRWKKLPWHKKPQVGLTAVVDINQIRTAGYTVFRKHFKNHHHYEKLMNLLIEACTLTLLGQNVDVNVAIDFRKQRDVNLLPRKNYLAVAKYKTDYITYKIPLVSAMYLTGSKDVKILEQFENVVEKLSLYRQAQNDIWDCFGKYENLGKIGTDIWEGKCTWVSVTALECATDDQKRHYGREDVESQKEMKMFSERITDRLGCHEITLDDYTYETFITIFPQMVKESLIDNLEDEMIPVFQHFIKSADYVIGSNREFYIAPTLLKACKAFNEPKKETPESVRSACTLAWCFEMEAIGALLLDDLVDNANIRREKQCLHSIYGIRAINTSTLLRTCGRTFLKNFFKDHPFYKSLLNVLSDITYKTYIGQLLDVNISDQFKKYRNLDLLSMERYLPLTKYKRSYFQFRQPVLAAMCLHNKHLKEFPKIENVLDKLSFHLQTTNDMWDCYGKIETCGTDVSEAKCTWLTATAVECMNTKQKQLFRQYYGKSEEESRNIIKHIYHDIKIPEKYTKHTLDIREELTRELQKTDQPEIRNLLQSLVDTVFT